MLDALLLSGGGHARVVAEIAMQQGIRISAYTDPQKCAWLGATVQYESDEMALLCGLPTLLLGLGGVSPLQLSRRRQIVLKYADAGFRQPPLLHNRSIVSAAARLGRGACVMAGAIIQAGATIGDGVIVNSGSIIEHNVEVKGFAHIAPGAIILGGAQVGVAAMIGAGAIVLPGAAVPDGITVSAGARFFNGS